MSALAATLRLPRVTGYKWVILAVGLASQTAISAVRQGLPSIAPALRDTYSLSLQQLGLVLAAINVGIVLTLFVWGVLADRIGERTVLTTGLAAAAGALVGAALAPSFGWLLAGLLAAGMAGASAIGGSGRAVMGWFERSERGMALGVRQTGVPLGGGLAAIALDAAEMLGLESQRARVRICASETCSARFYDRSPAGVRRWCSMSLCGNVAKARRHRSRRRAEAVA